MHNYYGVKCIVGRWSFLCKFVFAVKTKGSDFPSYVHKSFFYGCNFLLNINIMAAYF